MTDHVHGEGSYVEADWYTVVWENRLEDMYPTGWDGETSCYCGADSEYSARVGFHTDTTEETPGSWPTSITQNVKVHRCEEHRFGEESDEQ